MGIIDNYYALMWFIEYIEQLSQSNRYTKYMDILSLILLSNMDLIYCKIVIILGLDGMVGIVILASCDHQFIRVHENKSDTTYK